MHAKPYNNITRHHLPDSSCLSLPGVLWFLETSLHQKASWTAQDPLWLCHSILSLPHDYHARLRKRETVHFSTDQQILEFFIGWFRLIAFILFSHYYLYYYCYKSYFVILFTLVVYFIHSPDGRGLQSWTSLQPYNLIISCWLNMFCYYAGTLHARNGCMVHTQYSEVSFPFG